MGTHYRMCSDMPSLLRPSACVTKARVRSGSAEVSLCQCRIPKILQQGKGWHLGCLTHARHVMMALHFLNMRCQKKHVHGPCDHGE